MTTIRSASSPLWIRAVVSREGDFLVTKCCIVADADVHPFEVRVNMRQLAGTLAKMRAEGRLKFPDGGDSVSGFGSFLKKAGRAITRNKITKAVGKVVKKVVSNPVVQLANPMAAIVVHTSSRALGGKGVIRGPAGKIVDLGAAVAAPAGLAHVAPKAIAALGLGAKTVMATKAGSAIANVAKSSQAAIKLGTQAAAQLKTGQISAAVANPLVKKALAVRSALPRLAPALATRAKMSKEAKKRLVSIAARAKAGDPDAKYTAAVIARTAKMTDDISRAQQAAGGGNPGFVITRTGKIRKAPKGKFIQQASLPIIETLYRGATATPLRGSFAAVSGGMHEHTPAWGGYDDPADQYEGPSYPARYPDAVGGGRPGKRRRAAEFYERRTLVPSQYPELEAEVYRTLVEDEYQRNTLPAPPRYPAVSGARDAGWKGAPGTTAAVRDRVKALLELARARHHVKMTLGRARTTKTKVGNMSHYELIGSHIPNDIPGEMTEQSDGIPSAAQRPEIVGCPLPAVGADIMIGGLPWYVFTARNLRMPVIQRRFLAGLKAMPPKTRRRVIRRLKALHLRSKISGAVRNLTPTVGYDLQGYGWAGVSGCSQVAGPLTP